MFPVNLKSKNGYGFGKVFGSVNGLICFGYVSLSSSTRDVVYIWNPSLSTLLTLSPCYLPSYGEKQNHFRFGYNSKTDDYKVIKFTSMLYPPSILAEVEVYSMRKGSWELITQSFPSHITKIWDYEDFCVDSHAGHLHWLGSPRLKCYAHMILAFDLCAETFREIPLPDSILNHDEHRDTELGVFDGKLCVMSRVGDGEREVWVMDEYGVAESWAKHHAFSQLRGQRFPYGFTSDSKLLFRVGCDCDCHCVGLYDPIVAMTKTFKINVEKILNRIVEYVDSLVWVTPMKREWSKGL